MAFPGLRARQVIHREQRQLLQSVIPYPIKETWTHDFCCLPFTHQETTPTPKQAELLHKAGLGKTKVVFANKNANHAQVVQKLEETFPQLKSVGGFTLHRSKSGGQNRPLTLLATDWYDIKRLRQEVTGSACIYIRPLQRNFDLSLKRKPTSDDANLVECETCKKMVPIKNFAQHKPCSPPEKFSVDEVEVIKIDEFDADEFFAEDTTMNNEFSLLDNSSTNEEVDLTLLRQHRISYLCSESGSPGGEETSQPITPPDPFKDKVIIKVHRANLRVDLINSFSKDVDKSVEFIVFDFCGREELGAGKGVTRDIFAAFWKDVSNSLMIGEEHRVPYVRHDLFTQEWEAVGRIMFQGYKDCCYFPIFLSSAFVCFTIFDDVSDELLLDSFYLYLAADEKTTIQQSIETFDNCDENELLEVLERFKCRKRVTAENIKDVVLELAKQELIQKPHIMASVMRPFLQKLKQYPDFESPANIHTFYQRVVATPRKILKLLKSNPTTDQERDSLKYFERYVRGLQSPDLVKLLRFLTGSDIITVEDIEVTFTSLEGNARRPIAHTCGPVLELPCTYDNFCDLRQEFQSILSVGDLGFDIV